jgi:hypothetical protein
MPVVTGRFADLKPPLSGLFDRGEPEEVSEYPDYQAEGFGPEHIPDLIRIVLDEDLNNAPTDRSEVWAPLYAGRILSQLRAAEAAEPLTRLLRRIDDLDDDWAAVELPAVFAMIGPPAIPALKKYLLDTAHPLYVRLAAAEALKLIAEKYPDRRDDCVDLLAGQLAAFNQNHETVNAFLIKQLAKLKAVKHAPLMEQAFAADRVDESVTGDWEDIQVELGLKAQRDSPEPSPGFLNLFRPRERWTPPVDPELVGLPRKERRQIERERAKALRKQRKAGIAPAEAPRLYQLMITLQHSEPPIWRRVIVPGEIKLSGLRHVISMVMGWEDFEHLHQFSVVPQGRGPELVVEDADEATARLREAAPTQEDVLFYLYDFGDSWKHKITIEKIAPADVNSPSYPICLGGARACPPEDCGGIGPYEWMLETLSDPKPNRHEYREAVIRLGKGFDPEAFDLKVINVGLKNIEL